MSQTSARVQVFRRLHESGCFVIPNPWDVGSARVLETIGFPALATTSSEFAWSLGRLDGEIAIDQALTHFRSSGAGGGCLQRGECDEHRRRGVVDRRLDR